MMKTLRILLITFFWIALWQMISVIVGEEILFPSPISTCNALFELCLTPDFWKIIGITCFRILIGVMISSFLGILSGILAGLFQPFEELLSPLLVIIRTAPIASFIVLLVLWLKRSTVPMVIASLIVLPVFYSNAREGIRNTDRKLLEMADAYGMNPGKKMSCIYLPSMKPYLFSAAGSSFGMAWKAGVAAEVIVLPVLSIGRQLYYASNNLETEQVFAWTAAVIILSLLMDKITSLIFGGKSRQKHS